MRRNWRRRAAARSFVREISIFSEEKMIKKSILILFMMGFAASHAAAAGGVKADNYMDDFPLSDHKVGCPETTYPFTLGDMVAAWKMDDPAGKATASMNRGNDGLYHLKLNISMGEVRFAIHPQDSVAVIKRIRVVSLLGSGAWDSPEKCETMVGPMYHFWKKNLGSE